MTNKKKPQYYCFECKYAKSSYGVLICRVYRGTTEPQNKACLDFELKEGFKRRQNNKAKKKN